MTYQYQGKTALVTGASSGIGEEFARQLAARGMHLVLVARSAGKLQALADELSARHGIRVQVIPGDLGKPGAARQLLEACQSRGLHVDLLANNAGCGTFGAFETISPERDNEMIQLNCVALCDMAHAFIPPMLAKGEGAIINTASSAGFQPTPWFAAYGATKAFALSLSESLWALYRRRGIRVTAVCPGPVATGFFAATQSNIQDVKLFQHTLTAERVVREGLRAMERRRPTIVNGRLNWLQAFSARLGPRWLTAIVSEFVMRPPQAVKN